MSARRAAAAAIGAAALALVVAPAAQGASRTVTVEGWWPRAMTFSDRALVWTEAAPVRVDPRRIPGSPPGAVAFTYYRAEAFRATLDRAGRRFAGTPETLISIRTSIAAMRPGVLAPMPTDGLVAAPWSPRFAAPVVACCSPDGEEIEVHSEGRPDALPAVAAAWDGTAVRWVQLRPDGTQVLRRQGDPVPTGTRAPRARAWWPSPRTGAPGWTPRRRRRCSLQDDRAAGSSPGPWRSPGPPSGSGRRRA